MNKGIESENSEKKKIYIMATACSGKTTFAGQNKQYRNIRIVDFAKFVWNPRGREHERAYVALRKTYAEKIISHFRKMVVLLKLIIRKLYCRHEKVLFVTGKTYDRKIISYLRSENVSVCVLGRRGPVNPKCFPDITFAAVVMPREEHERNWRNRTVSNPKSLWGEFSKIEDGRKRLLEHAEEHGIAVYESFRAAIDGILDREKEDGE